MRFTDWLLGRGPVLDAAQSSTGPQFDPIGVGDIDPAVFGITSYSDPIAPAPRISRREAIQLPALKRARDLIAGTIGGLPLDVIDTEKITRINNLLSQPERNVPRSVTMTRTVEDLLFEQIAWWRVTEREFDGFPKFVERVDPCRVTVDSQAGIVRIDGQRVADAELIRFDSPNDGLLCAGARAIRAALKVSATLAMYADEPAALMYFTPADPNDPADDDDVKEILNDWKQARKLNATGYVPAAMKLNQAGFSPEQLQLTEVLKAAVVDIANTCGIDSEALNVSTTSRTYFNAEHKRREFVDFTLSAYLKAIEDRLSMGDVTKRGYFVRFNLDAFLRSDTKTRMETYKLGLEVGAYTKPEIRDLEDKPALPESEQPVASAVAASEFDNQTVTTFDAPAPGPEFKVDLEMRTIRGIAVPYGRPAMSKGRTWSFSKGSLKYDDVSRVKLLDGHDWSKPIGRAVALDETDSGLVATFSVVNTPAGDEALLMASERVKDGLSIGVAEGGTYDEKDGVLFAVAAPLVHVALTPCPAFDDARVTAVAASNERNNAVTDTKPDTEVSAPAQTFSVEQTRAIEDMIKASGAQANKPEVPDTISPALGLSVDEPLPYRFDGMRGEHEFSSDLFAMYRDNSGEARQRIDRFMSAAFDVTTTNTASVNPNRQRPDLFVDYLAQKTPVWDAINKGTLPDATPFVVPKYNTSSGLVGDHTEGTEPTEGAYSTTSQTVTPTALSGKVEITREVIDAGGSPQVSGLIWGQIQRKYAEALEAKAVALLDGLTPTAIAIATADITPGVELEAAFANLQFVQGGDRFDKLVLQADLYKALVAQVDSTGRPMYPQLSPQNANGQVASGYTSIMIGAKQGVPAWALGASGVVSESSYLFSSEDVHGWASAPQQLRFEYQVATVTLGVWGYVATANTRLEGVREITYDPTV